jgi:hypothetical protein
MSITPKLLDTKQAAEHLNLQPQTLTVWRHYGRGPAFLKIGNRIRYREDDLAAFAESNRHQSTSEPGPASLREVVREVVREALRELAREGPLRIG